MSKETLPYMAVELHGKVILKIGMDKENGDWIRASRHNRNKEMYEGQKSIRKSRKREE